MRAEQKRKERDQEIDKWLDDIKEKNQKIKRVFFLKLLCFHKIHCYKKKSF